MNKYEKNIVDLLTFQETEEIVDIFLDFACGTDKTIALITDKELVEYAMYRAVSCDYVNIRKVDLDLYDVEYMISVNIDGDMVVQPVEYYDDRYFDAIEYAFVDMDGIVCQTTIDALLDKDVSVVLFGYDDDGCDCDQCECACQKDEKLANTSKSQYFVNGKSVNKSEFDKEYENFEEKYLDNIRDMILNYSEFMDKMNGWRSRLFW